MAPLDSSVHPAQVAEDNTHDEVHPEAQRWFAVAPVLRKVPLFGDIASALGPKFAIAVGASYFLSKGSGSNMISTSRQPMFTKHYGVDGTRYQRLSSTFALGWSMKALIAVFTDIFPLFGYSKRWYLVLSAILGSIFTLTYALMPGRESSATPAAAFIFLACFCKCSVDILTEGQYSRVMRNNPKVGSAIVSWAWACTYGGTLLSASMMGPLSDKNLTYVGLIVAAALQAFTVGIFAFNFLEEQPNRQDRLMDALALYELEKGKSSGAAAAASPDYTIGVMHTTDAGDTTVHNRRTANSLSGESNKDEATKPYLRGQVYHDSDDTMQPKVSVHANNNTGDAAPVSRPVPTDEAHFVQSHEPVTTMPYGHAMDGKDSKPTTMAVGFVEPDIQSCLCGVFDCNKDLLLRSWRLVILCLTVTACVIILACVSLLGTRWQLMYACIASAAIMFAGAFLALPRSLALTVIFVYLNSALYIQFPGPLSTFYLASPACVPGGPFFTYTFYITVAALVSDVAGIVGATLFTYLFSRQSYSFVFIITTLLQVMGSIFDLIIVKRWNLAIGIPDKIMYLFGDSVVYKVCAVLSIMPAQMLMSRLCHRGTESMTFSMISGYNNVGTSMAVAIGSLLIETRFPIATRRPCNFSNVPWLIIIGHFCVPLIIIPLSMLMLPSARMCDNIDVHGNVITVSTKQKPPSQSTPQSGCVYVNHNVDKPAGTNTDPQTTSSAK